MLLQLCISSGYRCYLSMLALDAIWLHLLKFCRVLCHNSSITQGLEGVDGLKAFSFTFSSILSFCDPEITSNTSQWAQCTRLGRSRDHFQPPLGLFYGVRERGVVCDVQQGSKVTCTFLWGVLSYYSEVHAMRDRVHGGRGEVWHVGCGLCAIKGQASGSLVPRPLPRAWERG